MTPIFSGRFIAAFAVLGTLFAGAAGCTSQQSREVSLEAKSPQATATTAHSGATIRIGMGAMITPKEGYVYYQKLHDYLQRKSGWSIQLVDRESYDEVNKLLETGDIEAAFVCAGPYIEGHDRFGLELLAMPVVNGRPTYHSYIIVPAASPAESLEELRGKTFAFTDPKSNSGRIVPTFMLSERGETPDTFFGKYIYTYGHDKSISAVANNLVDGAAVDSLIWDFFVKNRPDLIKGARIIAKSPPCGIPPFVVRPGLDPRIKNGLKERLLEMHADPEGKAILAGMMIDRFIAGDERNYDSIRAMLSRIASQKRVR